MAGGGVEDDVVGTIGTIKTQQTCGFLYAGLDFTEGVGLWFEKRWAEVLTAVATAVFVPIEIYEIYERFTFIRVLILVVNLFVIWYLATRVKDEKKEELATNKHEKARKGKIQG